MYFVDIPAFNYAAVFGTFFAIYLVSQIDVVARSCVTFVKGWRS